MPQPVPALGCAVVTAAGCVWYLPAFADLRAGADRPLSRRTAALACLTGWGTLGTVALALLVTTAWWVPGAVAAAGGPAAVALRIRAAVRRAGERREAARQWAQLPHGPLPADPYRPRGAVAGLVVAGPAAGAALAAALGAGGGRYGTAATALPVAVVAVPAAVVGLFLALAVRHTRTSRRTAADRGRRPG
ncbi:hypothetical protein [Streptomyces sp. Tu 3180]|uniref:hypothetical protein n=1 Tax=Streptomyces sp. Tu 3180 TaxID=2682611 RepID=UPI00135832B0|nr:hypothetical protein [Streptomyces sp. Tu 3180]KAF3467436.1 hypothetical protein GL259_26115 [Streptomyces sp. Tu 3180]